MSEKSRAHSVPLHNFKRTKIIATVGPATDSYESIKEMIASGADGLRLNFSHGDPEEREQQIKWIRKAQEELNKPVAIIQDLQGPKIRLGDFDGILNVRKGQNLEFKYNADLSRSGIIPLQYDLSKKIKRGERLLLFDGRVKTVVTSVKNGIIHARSENEGILVQRKGINLPDTDFGGDIVTTKDKKDIVFGASQDIDYVALSFVQTSDDIEHLRRLLSNSGSKVKIIAKIETSAAVDNLEEIFEAADVVMVARGDLAVETLPESVPVLQRQIIGLGLQYRKPTIVATQMLGSMTETTEPTRAEVSDIATAVIVGADCVMLSDETASGKYPIEAVKVMKRVIMYTQTNSNVKAQFPDFEEHTRQSAIAASIIDLAETIKAKAIVAETKTGATVLNIAAWRPDLPVVAITADERVSHQLSIVYGTECYRRPVDKNALTKLTNWLRDRKVLNRGDVIVTASGKYPGVVGTTDTIKVRVL